MASDLAGKKSAAIILRSLLWGPSLTWKNAVKFSQLNKNSNTAHYM